MEEVSQEKKMDDASVSENEGVCFQMVSDIHLEFPGCVDKLPEIPVKAPILALLGDIGYATDDSYHDYLYKQAERFEHVLVVAGNHEYYCQPGFYTSNHVIEQVCSAKPNLHFLNRKSVVIGDVVFLGCTLWSLIPRHLEGDIFFMCNDYHQILVENDGQPFAEDLWKVEEGKPYTKLQGKRHGLTPQETNKWHAEEVEWLKQEVEKIRQQNNESEHEKKTKVVVLTHHAPSKWRCLEPQSRGTDFQHIEYDSLEDMFGDPIVVWGFGHTHWSSDNILNGTRVVSNQCGYITVGKYDGKGSNWFDPGLVININQTIESIKAKPKKKETETEEVEYPEDEKKFEKKTRRKRRKRRRRRRN
jgi:predicted phosphohydrolase